MALPEFIMPHSSQEWNKILQAAGFLVRS